MPCGDDIRIQDLWSLSATDNERGEVSDIAPLVREEGGCNIN